MKNLIYATLASAAGLVFAVPASAQTVPAAARSDCALRIDGGATNWIIQGYDPFASSEPIAIYEAVFNNEGGAACVFDPVFVVSQETFGLSHDGGQGRVNYTLLDQFSNSNATPTSGRTIGRATQRPIVVRPHSQQLVRFQFAVDEDGLVADGLYSQRVTLIAEKRGQGEMLASRSLVLGVNVLPSAVLGLSGQYRRNGGQALVDLGELSEGVAQIPLQVTVASTRAYRLEFASKNNGLLKMADADWSVPYQLMVGESTLSLASTANYSSSGTDPTRDALPMRFVIGSVAGKRAGLYSDLITVSIAPR
ncbi:hypothetical protein FHS95_003296 [Sphingomonas naasensis]|uniref:Spore coat protein U domain-containing protein n=1 Tax=Sphingomonas naasensis TaxID=1344951 RepID=A0A4S1WEK7_9SPHN|nr:hypothetical protein [Sphingomonas naasensis]NIJ21593.1 hypothetical protein [Sphingomonas naasensis]TGX41468.1 hypothetical protein E5A74_12625 [Sphingomonas naasensis]